MLALLVGLLWPALALAQVVDRVVAEVGEQVLLESDIQLERELSRLDRSDFLLWRPTWAPAEERVVQAAVLRELAGEASVFVPSDEAVAARLEALRLRFPSREAWEAFLAARGLRESSLRAVLRRRMIAERYVERTLSVSPSDEKGWASALTDVIASAQVKVRWIQAISP